MRRKRESLSTHEPEINVCHIYGPRSYFTHTKKEFASIRESNRLMLFYTGKESLMIVSSIENTPTDTLYGQNVEISVLNLALGT